MSDSVDVPFEQSSIMRATYLAMAKHGYADLTVEKIAEEYDKGKSNIYYHYDDKQELMEDFLNQLVSEMKRELRKDVNRTPEEKFDSLLSKLLGMEDERMWEFRKTIFEMKAQAPYNEEFSDRFKEIYDLITLEVTKIFREAGFEDCERRAELTIYAMDGVVGKFVSTDERKDPEEVKRKIKDTVWSTD